MGTKFFDLDINAKLPIIRVESLDDPTLNGIADSTNNHSKQNGITNHHDDGGDNQNHHHHDNKITHNKLGDTDICNADNNNQQLDLPKPSFRLAQNYHYKKRTHTASSQKLRKEAWTKDSYYHYDEPSPDDLMERVEYDMDEQDSEWLKMFNERTGDKYNHPVTESEFEQIMDRLEKESYFESSRTGNAAAHEVDEDAVCAICKDGDCRDANVILFCDMCDLAVHQECYGVPYIPDGQWLCRRCLQSPSKNVDCVLCPNKGGAFKQTDDNRWAHVICALWVPEVCFANTVFLEPIDSIDQIPSARWKLNCYICKQKRIGACIQCHKPNCYVPFHVTCAQQAGLYMKIRTFRYNTADGALSDVKKEAFCDAHGPKTKFKGGMYEGESDEDLDSRAYKKWKAKARDKLKKTRKILAERRTIASNPIALPRVKHEKLIEISKLITMRGKRKSTHQLDDIRKEYIQNIQGYWVMKRSNRRGVPLLRRLQVSYNNNGSTRATAISLDDSDRDDYTRLRYDLEKARLLVGEVKKRELLKKRLFKISKEVVEMKYQVIDNEHPPTEE